MIYSLMAEAEEEMLEERLTQQRMRLEERERKLEDYDLLRQRIEYEKAALRAEARERRKQDEIEQQLQVIEAAEEQRRQDDMLREQADAQRRLQERMGGMTAAQRTAYLEDLSELEALEEKLAATTEALEQRQETMKRYIAGQEESRRQAEQVVSQFIHSCTEAHDALCEEEGASVAAIAEQLDCLRARHEAECLEVRRAASLRELAVRRSVVEASLTDAEQQHLATLTEDARVQLLDEMHELAVLKQRLKRTRGSGSRSQEEGAPEMQSSAVP